MRLERSLEQWAGGKSAVIAEGSKAQMMYFIEDAQKDIAALAREVATKDAEIERLSAQNEWLKDRISDLQLPRNDTRNIEEWLVECGMPKGGAA